MQGLHKMQPKISTRLRIGLGVGLILLSGAGIGYPLWWNYRSSSGATRLLAKYQTERIVSNASSPRNRVSKSTATTCVPTGGPGVLSIPAISLVAPVQQGIDDAVLNVSVGHNPATSWPGPDSAALLAAHDVSFFSRISQLQAGDEITYTVACGTYVFRVSKSEIAVTGAQIAVPASGAVVLDTCWPTNALWFTPHRLIVTANYEGTVPTSSTQTVSPPTSTPTSLDLSTNLPSALNSSALTLSNNTQLMGSLTFSGTPSPAFTQSNGPMQLEAAALTAWFAAIHTLESAQSQWWSYFAPQVNYPTQLSGKHIVSTSALQVTEDVTGNTVVGVTLEGGLNGLQIIAHETIAGHLLSIDSYRVF